MRNAHADLIEILAHIRPWMDGSRAMQEQLPSALVNSTLTTQNSALLAATVLLYYCTTALLHYCAR